MLVSDNPTLTRDAVGPSTPTVQRCRDSDPCCIRSRGFVVTSGDRTPLLQAGPAPFYQVAVAVDEARARLLLLGVLARRHDRGRAHRLDGRAELCRVAGHVCQGPGGGPGQALQQFQRRGQLVRLARHQDEVDEAAISVANAYDLGAEAAAGAADRLLVAAFFAIESQTQCVGLLGRAPAAFWCARATVPSMQAKASFGSASATTCAMILSQTPLTAQRR